MRRRSAPPAPSPSAKAGTRVATRHRPLPVLPRVRDGLPSGAIAFTRDYRLAASRREDLVVARRRATRRPSLWTTHPAGCSAGRSSSARSSAGGCNACEADTNVLGTVAWDLGRFGIQFVASPRHADGLLVTGPVSENMRLALQKTYEAVPCAEARHRGRRLRDLRRAVRRPPRSPQRRGRAAAGRSVRPRLPAAPADILDGLLSLLGRVANVNDSGAA